jgi:hypothetical protein
MRTVSVPVPHVSGTKNSVLGSILPKQFMFQVIKELDQSWVRFSYQLNPPSGSDCIYKNLVPVLKIGPGSSLVLTNPNMHAVLTNLGGSLILLRTSDPGFF